MKSKQPRDSQTISLWQNVLFEGSKSNFSEQVIYDVLIVGGGITGITTGLLLQQQGKSVVIAEGNTIGFGTTGGTSAHLNNFFDSPYPQVENDFGFEAAQSLAKAGKQTISFIKSMVDRYQIDCDFEYKRGFLFAQDSNESKQLTDILGSSIKVGIDAKPADTNGINVPYQTSIVFADQAQFHPLKYIYKLAEEFVAAGGILLEHTFIRDTTFENDIHITKSDDLQIQSKNLVYATHLPPGINLLDFTCAPYRSYVLGITLKNNDYLDCLSYDMKEPYHYLRTHTIDGQKYLVAGGEDHKTGHDDPETAFKNLEDWVSNYYEIASVDYKWSAQYYVPADGLPYIGHLPGGANRIYIATGYNGNGMIFGTLSAQIITDMILHKENEYAALFSPSRIKPVAGFQDFVRENVDVAYKFVADRIAVDEIESIKEIEPGNGEIVKYKDEKLAIYKDNDGKIHALSPVCTHAGCIVNFNKAEQSWDCPCHGGRFDTDGNVLTGPPRLELKKVNIQ